MINKLLSFFLYFFRLMKSMIFMPVMRAARKIRTFANPQLYAMKIAKSIGKFLKTKVKLKPQKMGDYFEFKYKYVAKSLFIIIPLLVIALVVASIQYVHPWIVSKFFTAVFFEDNARLEQYNGKVNVLALKNSKMIFLGKLENGLKTGYGKLFLQDGTLQYEGDFANSLYEGFGKLYDAEGKLAYEGKFSAGEKQGFGKEYLPGGEILHYEGNFEVGQYEGEGILYFDKGTVEYRGAFAAGGKEGDGILYSENGTIVYKGAFAAGEKEGKGILYSDKGVLQYKGDFAAGQIEGKGTRYDEKGGIVYKGLFAAGNYEGEGSLYNKDGSILYSGAFVNGTYSGKGKLYLEGTSRYIEGEFLEGKAQGPGSIFKEGLKVYEGNFFAGIKQGEGKLFSKTGEVIFQGIFQEDSMMVSNVLGVEASELAGFFPQKAEYLQYENNFTFAPKAAGCMAVLNYAEEELPAAVQEVFFWKLESSGLAMMADEELNKDNLDILMGKVEAQKKVSVDPVIENALIHAGVEDIMEGDLLSTRTYVKDDLNYIFYFSGDSPEIILLKIGMVG